MHINSKKVINQTLTVSTETDTSKIFMSEKNMNKKDFECLTEETRQGQLSSLEQQSRSSENRRGDFPISPFTSLCIQCPGTKMTD